MSALEELWPSENATHDTLGVDAQSLDLSVFLAVHQPMRFRRLEFGKQKISDAPARSEHELLTALLLDEGEGRVIIPIAGGSGAGKSHVVKWLEAELRARDDSDTRHVILVPKNSSLKSVLRLILRDLEGALFDEIRNDLERASDSLPAVAARDLRTRIVSTLKTDAEAAQHRLRAGDSIDRQGDERLRYGGTISALLDETVLWDKHFFNEAKNGTGVVGLLARNVTHEGPAERRRGFQASDFEGLAGLAKIADLSQAVRALIPRLQDANIRQIVADSFNSVLDRATGNLLDLGGTPLSEIFLRLREALLAVSKELVILVEDFAVLSGMQDSLLKALVQEARVDGTKRYCTIRSALAYTRGYKGIDLDTLQTRADAQWLIEDVPGTQDEILHRSVELVGAYFNAARWGVERLRAMRATDADRRDWLATCEAESPTEEEENSIESFGRTARGYPLFPLNHGAVRQLVREKSTINGELVYRPRLIIQRVVLHVLKLRQHFLQGQFPPKSLGRTNLLTDPEVLDVLASQPENQKERLATLVAFWGEMPTSKGEAARLSALIYSSFGLRPVNFGAPLPKRPSVQPPLPGSNSGSVVPNPVKITDPFDRHWKPIIEAWQRGERLLQKPANAIRKWIAEAMLGVVPNDWPGSRSPVKKDKLASKHVYLPNARGATGRDFDTAAIALCSDEDWADPLRAVRYRQELEALIRFHGIEESNGRWNYRGAEKHAAHYGTFIARRRGRLLARFPEWRRENQKLKSHDIGQLVENSLLASALLGRGVRGGNRLDSAMDVLFSEPPESVVGDAAHSDWKKAVLSAHRRGVAARKDIIEASAVRQGTGKKVIAVDVASLAGAARSFMKRWTLTEGPKDHSSFATDADRGIAARKGELGTWSKSLDTWLGPAFDKDSFIDEVRTFLTAARAEGLARDDDIESLRTIIATFRETKVSEAIAHARHATAAERDGPGLVALAHDYSTVIQVTNRLSAKLESVLDQVDTNITAAEGVGKSSADEMAKQVAAELASVLTLTNEYGDLRNHDGT